MEAARILIAMSNDTSMDKLKTILMEFGHTVIDQARESHECIRKIRTLRPDLVIIDYGMSPLNGWEIAKVTLEDNLGDVILLATDAQRSLFGDITAEGAFVCMLKPLNKIHLINTIELMVKNRRKIKALEKEILELRENLDTRKEVERAKGLLMRHLNLSEAEAFKRIQKQSMDRGIPMKEIAKAIILAYDI